MTDDFVVSLYTYPWDLSADGLDIALDRIADVAACDEVMLTPCYHRSEYYLPHNPKHPVYFGENGAIFFDPDLGRYRNTRIEPRVSREVVSHDYFDEMAEAITAKGLMFGAWMVYTYQNYLSEKYPEFAKHDAFGTPYVGQLSTTPADISEYFIALTTEVMERFKPGAVWVESLMRRGFPMPGKRRNDIPLRCRFLLSLCFNPASLANAETEGMDGERFRLELVDWMRPLLAAGADPDTDEAATPEWIAEAFDGQLRSYLDISGKYTTELWLRVVDVIRSHGAKVQTDLADPVRATLNDLTTDINDKIDRVSFTPVAGEDSRTQVAELERQIAPGGCAFLRGAKASGVAAATESLTAAIEAGGGGINFYNYGLLTEQQLGYIGEAVRGLRG